MLIPLTFYNLAVLEDQLSQASRACSLLQKALALATNNLGNLHSLTSKLAKILSEFEAVIHILHFLPISDKPGP